MANGALLLKRLRNGERGAFELLLDQYGPCVQKLARRYAVTNADAEDLTQEIFSISSKTWRVFADKRKFQSGFIALRSIIARAFERNKLEVFDNHVEVVDFNVWRYRIEMETKENTLLSSN